MPELSRRQIDRHGQALMSQFLPLHQLITGGTQDPAANGEDQAGGFCDGDDFIGPYDPANRMAPAQQGLETQYLPGFKGHFGLIVDFKFVIT